MTKLFVDLFLVMWYTSIRNMKVGIIMSTALEQKEVIDALFERFDKLSQSVDDFRNSYMTQTNPAENISTLPVQEDLTSNLTSNVETIREEAANVNDLVNNIDIDALMGNFDLEPEFSEPSTAPVANESQTQSSQEFNIDDIDIDALLSGIDMDNQMNV